MALFQKSRNFQAFLPQIGVGACYWLTTTTMAGKTFSFQMGSSEDQMIWIT